MLSSVGSSSTCGKGAIARRGDMGLREAIVGFIVGILIIALAVGAMEAVLRRRERRVKQLREVGRLPPEGKASMADVDAQLALGERQLAVTLYREIHGVAILEARAAVARLARSRPGS